MMEIGGVLDGNNAGRVALWQLEFVKNYWTVQIDQGLIQEGNVLLGVETKGVPGLLEDVLYSIHAREDSIEGVRKRLFEIIHCPRACQG